MRNFICACTVNKEPSISPGPWPPSRRWQEAGEQGKPQAGQSHSGASLALKQAVLGQYCLDLIDRLIYCLLLVAKRNAIKSTRLKGNIDIF